MSKNLENALKKEMNNRKRNSVLQFLPQHLINDNVSQNAVNAAKINFNVHRNKISRLWKQAKTSKLNYYKFSL